MTFERRWGEKWTRPVLVPLVGLFLGQAVLRAEPVRVELKSGRTYRGEVDSQTSDTQLCLRFGNDQGYLLRAISWDYVSRAERNGQAISVEDLRKLAPDLATRAASPMPVAPTDRAAAPAVALDPLPTKAAHMRLASVQFDAFLANWDGDVEADGLIVRLMPLTDEGQLAHVDGTLDVDLAVVRRRGFSEFSDARGRSFERLGRWTQAISAAEIGPSGATIRLPFQAGHPEFDTTASPYGLVHLRYSAPGHGAFEASQDVVRIRPFAPLRDVREQSGQGRFLDLERLGR